MATVTGPISSSANFDPLVCQNLIKEKINFFSTDEFHNFFNKCIKSSHSIYVPEHIVLVTTPALTYTLPWSQCRDNLRLKNTKEGDKHPNHNQNHKIQNANEAVDALSIWKSFVISAGWSTFQAVATNRRYNKFERKRKLGLKTTN